MNKFYSVALVLFLYIAFTNNLTAAVKWQKNIEESTKKAQQENRPILINFYADWCQWCKKMDKETYANKKVASSINKNFIALNINPETDAKGSELAEKYAVTGFPAVIIVNSDGFILNSINGYVDDKAMISHIDKALAQDKKIKKVLATKEPSIDKLDIYIESGKEKEARSTFEYLLAKNLIPDESIPQYMIGIALLTAQSKNYDKALLLFDEVVKKYPDRNDVFIAHYYSAVTRILAGNQADALKYLQNVQKEYTNIPYEFINEYQKLIDYLESEK